MSLWDLTLIHLCNQFVFALLLNIFIEMRNLFCFSVFIGLLTQFLTLTKVDVTFLTSADGEIQNWRHTLRHQGFYTVQSEGEVQKYIKKMCVIIYEQPLNNFGWANILAEKNHHKEMNTIFNLTLQNNLNSLKTMHLTVLNK